MRVLTFLHSFEPGGVERVALRLVRQWRQEGVDAPLFMGRRDGAMWQELGSGLDCHVPRQPLFSTAPFETLWMIVTLPWFIRRIRPDALFCAGNSYAVVAVAMKLVLGRACPPILAKISNDLERRDMPWPVRLCYRLWLRIQGRFIDHFVATAPGLEREIAQWVRPRSGRISIVPSPALTSAQIDRVRAIRPGAVSTDPYAPRRFVAIGRLAPQKNFPLMLNAFSATARARDRLLILGDGPDREALIAQAAKLGIGAQVEFAGHIPDAAARLLPSDILLLSSDYEGLPSAVLEALAVGAWIIATDCSRAMRPLLRDGALGVLVPPGDLRALGRAVGNAVPMAQDPVGSLEQARRFTLEAGARTYMTHFAALARRGRSPSASQTRITSRI